MSADSKEAGPVAIRPVVLSGGSGTRLWPLSRRMRPKQFVPLIGEDSLFAQTLARVSGAPFRPPLVIASARHRALLAEELAKSGTPAALILEPSGRNTAAAVAAAALWAIRRQEADTVLALLPADHHIGDPARFRAALLAAARLAAAEDVIVTLGIRPDRPATGYGYIEAAEPLGEDGFRVRRFHEKPDAPTAARYLQTGGFYWNAGIFVARARTVRTAFAAHAPAIWQATEQALAAAPGAEEEPVVLPADRWVRVPAISFDYAIMEKTDAAAVVPADCGWSDVGSFDALFALREKDAAGNAAIGPATMVAARDCLTISQGPRIAIHGLKGVVVVADGDAVLVIRKDDAQSVREIVARLEEEDPDRL